MCKSEDEFEESKERIKEAGNHLKSSMSIFRFLSLNNPIVFGLPVKDASHYSELFKNYNKYVCGIIDVHFNMIQAEYPFEKKMAYELASKLMSHWALILEETVKPNLRNVQESLKKDKEYAYSYDYANVLHNLCLSLKWLARGMNHDKQDEKDLCYSAINESKNIGQKCYDWFEDATQMRDFYYFKYIQRWLDYVATIYDHFKGIADNVDFWTMETAYTGPLFEEVNLLEKNEKIEPFDVQNWDKI